VNVKVIESLQLKFKKSFTYNVLVNEKNKAEFSDLGAPQAKGRGGGGAKRPR
jgi:hypothetical protein